MGDGVGVYKVLLELWLNRSFNFLDLADGFADVNSGLTVAKRNARTMARSVARRGHFIQCCVRDHTKHHRVFGANVGTKSARKSYAVNCLNAHLVH